MTPELRHHFESIVNSMSAKALRCLAMAGKLELGDLASYNGPHHPAHKYNPFSRLHPQKIAGHQRI